jgi:hypothetical protein
MDLQSMRTELRDRQATLRFSTDLTAGDEQTGNESARAARRGGFPT